MPVPQLSTTHGALQNWKKNQINIWDVTVDNGTVTGGENSFQIKQDNADKAVYFSALGQSGADWLDGAKFVFNKDLFVNGSSEGVQSQINTNTDSISNLSTSKADKTRVDDAFTRLNTIQNQEADGTVNATPVDGSFAKAISLAQDTLQLNIDNVQQKLTDQETPGFVDSNGVDGLATKINKNLLKIQDCKLQEIHDYMATYTNDDGSIGSFDIASQSGGLKLVVDTVASHTTDLQMLMAEDENAPGWDPDKSVKAQVTQLAEQVSSALGLTDDGSGALQALQDLADQMNQSGVATVADQITTLQNKVVNLEKVIEALVDPDLVMMVNDATAP